MSHAVQYIINDDGKKNAVIVPFREWELLTARYQKLRSKYNVLLGIQDSLKEIKQSIKQGKKLQTLDEFLNENSSQG